MFSGWGFSVRGALSVFLLVLVAWMGAPVWAAPPVIVYENDFAGKWGSSGSGDGQFTLPHGIALDSSGNVFVVEVSNARVQKFDADGQFISKFGAFGAGDGQFFSPSGVAINSSDEIYVVDFSASANRVQQFDANGTFIRKWGTGGSANGEFQNPRSLAVGAGGEVYVADYGNDRIQVFEGDGDFLQVIGTSGSGDGELSFPDGIAVDGGGNIYVADQGNNRVQVFNSSGAFVRTWGSLGSGDGQFDQPSGLALGAEGVVYVADFNNDRVQAFTTAGVFLGKWGTAGNGDGEFQGPTGLVATASGRVYVTNFDGGIGNRVQYFEPIWNVTMDEDGDPTPFSLTLSAFDGDADTLTWSIASGASNGTADASGTGTSKAISYTPNLDFNGVDNFDVQIDDGNAGTATRTVYVTINPINDGPVIDQAGPLQVTMSQDGNPTPFVAPVVTATDPEGDTILWSVSSAATNGTAVVSGSGVIPPTFTYTPTAGYTGPDTFTIQASDGSLSDTVEVEVTIEAAAEAPVIDQGAGPLTVDMDEDGTFTAPALSATDGDTAAGSLTWSVTVPASFGFAEVSGSGASPSTFTYTPATDYSGTDSFTIEVSDGVLTDSIMVDVTIAPQPDAPVIFQGAGPLSVTMSEDGTPTDFARPTLYATDVDGGTLTWSVASPASNGTAEVSGSGSSATVLDYTPDPDFAGSDSFTVQVSDGALSDTIVIQVTVTATNDDPPVFDQGAGPLTATMDEDGTFTAPALSATDPDAGATLTWSLNAPPASGTATISGSGTAPTAFTYVPNADFNGSDAFTVEVSDGENSDTIVVDVTVTPVNDLPVIDPDGGPLTVTMSEDGTPTGFVAPAISATDIDGDSLTWSISGPAANGTAAASGTGVSPAEITYVPDADFAGTDSFVVSVSDGNGTDEIAIEVTLEAVNDAPTIDQGDGPVIAGFNQGGDTPGFYSGPLSASDVDTDPAELTWSLVTPPTQGTAEVSGSGAEPATYTYTVGEEFEGADSFVVQVTDGEFTDTITVDVTVSDANDRPVITQGDGFLLVVMDEDGAPDAFVAPALDATDEDGDTLTWSVLSPAYDGTAVVTGEGPSPTTFTYTPNANYNGVELFTIQVSDGRGGTDEVVVSVTIHPQNDPAVITQGDGPLTVTMAEDGDFTAPEIAATDIDDDPLTWSVATQPSSGTATVSGEGSAPGVINYVPNADFTGADSFEVLVSDAEGDADTIAVNVTVTPVNDAPTIAEGDAAVVIMSEDGSPTAFAAPTVTATDAENDSLSWSLGVAAEHGTATATGDGASPSITYTPEANYFGVDGFTVDVSDGNGGTDTIVIAVTVNPTNDAPEIAEGDGPLTVTMEEDGEFTAPEISATDIDGDTLTWSIGTAASHGTALATGTGASPTLTYTPTADYVGDDAFVVVVSDNNGGTDTIAVEVTLTPVQDVPEIAQGDSISVTMSEDGAPTAFSAPTITALEVDGDTLTWSLSTEAAHGTATVTGTGVSPTVTYAPEANYFGSDSFTVEVSDGNGGTDTLTVNITIEAVSDGITITQGESVSVTMSENGTPTPFVAPTIEATGLESEFENWVWSISSAPSHGTATASGTGTSPATLTYRPGRNFDGEDTFTVQVSDGIGGSDQILVTVTVENVNNEPEVISSEFEFKGKWTISPPEGETRHTRISLAIGPNNELYVGENSHIRIYNADGELQRTLATFPADSLAVDESGAVYALTHSPLAIKKFSADGGADTTWSVDPAILPAGRIHSASTISVTPDGLARFVHFEKPYPISTTTIRLRGLGATGTLSHSANLPIHYYTGSIISWIYGRQSDPTNTNYVATIDGAGITYVRRQNHDPMDVASPYYPVMETVGVYSATGTKLREFGVPSVSRSGKRHVAVMQDGQELFLTESDRGKVEVVTGTGAHLTTFGRAGSADGEFTTISGLAVNGEARVYVSDTSAGRIQYFERTPIEGIVHTTMKEDGSFALPVIVVDGDGDTITWAVISGPDEGEGVVTGGAAVNYTPPVNFNGETSFVVAAQDGMGGSTEVEVRVTVEPVDDPPVITQGDGAISVLMSRNGSPVPFKAPRLSATDPDGDTLTWSLQTTWSSGVSYWVEYTIRTLGTIAGSATGPEFADYSFTPAQDYTGNDSFYVRVTDPKGLSDTIQINIGISSGSTSTTTGHFAQLMNENFDQFDINDDGSISRNEFVQTFPEASETSFEELDINGDGFLSQEEVDAGEVPFVGMGCVYPSEMKSISESIVGKVLEAVGGSLLPFISHR